MAAMLTMIAQQVQMAPEIRTDWLKDYSQVKGQPKKSGPNRAQEASI